MTEKRLELVRGLGAWASAAIVVGTMIGTGIFLKPAEMAREGRTVSVVFAAWIVGAILSIFGALSFAELGSAIPEAGGEYAYLRRAFGPVWGFLFGWMHSIVGRPSSLASIAAGMMRFVGFLIPAVGVPLFTVHIGGLGGWIPPYDFVFTWAQPLAVAWIAGMTGVNYLGVRLGGAVQVFLTAIKIMSVVIVIGVAFFAPSGPPHAPDPFWPAAGDSAGTIIAAFLATLAAALWAYDGWEDLNLVGSEVADPQRNFPRALVGGVSFVAIIYLLFSAACLKVLAVLKRGRFAAHRLRRRGARHRPRRGGVDHPGHGYFRARLHEFFGAERRARRLRHGPRRNIFQDCRRHPSEISHSRDAP